MARVARTGWSTPCGGATRIVAGVDGMPQGRYFLGLALSILSLLAIFALWRVWSIGARIWRLAGLPRLQAGGSVETPCS
jgi:hypothetical protein